MARLSKVWYGTLDYNCYELGHTWSPNCLKAIHMFGSGVFLEGLKLNVVFYLVDFLIRKEKVTGSNVKQLALNVLQSTTFLGVTGYVFLASVCCFRNSLGHFNIYTAAFLPGFISSLMGILIERRNRRCALTLYVANVACETLFRMLKARNIISPLPYGEVLLFACSMAVYMYQLREFSSRDFISKLLKYLFVDSPNQSQSNGHVVNNNGHLKQMATNEDEEEEESRPNMFFINYFRLLLRRVQNLPKSPLCTHSHSCFYSTLRGFARSFGVGFSINLALGTLSNIVKISRQPSLFFQTHLLSKNNFNLGMFFGCFVSIFKSVCCILRSARGSDDPLHTIPAGFLAGLSMIFYRNSTVALYVVWRVIEIFYRSGMNAGYLPRWDAGVLALYAASTAMLFHAAVIEPHNLKPTYFKFIQRMTRGLVDLVNRRLIDDIGVESSSMFPNFIPNLDPTFMSKSGIAQMKNKYPRCC